MSPSRDEGTLEMEHLKETSSGNVEIICPKNGALKLYLVARARIKTTTKRHEINIKDKLFHVKVLLKIDVFSEIGLCQVIQ